MNTEQNNNFQCFSYGFDFENRHPEFFDYLRCEIERHLQFEFYSTPLPLDEIAKLARKGIYHAACLQLKKNLLSSVFIPSKQLPRAQFERFAFEFLVFGNAYLERSKQRGGVFSTPLAKYVRRGTDLNQYFFIGEHNEIYAFKKNHVFHLQEFDLHQEIYGVPQYIAAIHAIKLNESATIFRSRYFEKGSHSGYIVYISDPVTNQADMEKLEQVLKRGEHVGNARNIVIQLPNGKKDGIQIIPLAEPGTKDDFLNVKEISRDDQLAAHRVPPQLLGIIPQNAGGFGDVRNTMQIFFKQEIEPIMAKMQEVNEWAGSEIIKFKPPEELQNNPTNITK